ncbi:MAG: putative glycoside hydrolase [Clostridia bacterium]
MHPNNYRRYRRQKRNSTIKNILLFILLFIIGSGIAFFFMQEDGIFSSIGSNKPDVTIEAPEVEPEIKVEVVETVPPVEVVPVEEDVNAIYFDVAQVNNSTYVDEVFSLIENGQVNALVLPMKNDDGSFNYMSNLEYSTVDLHSTDLTNIITQAVNEDVYLIADVSVYADNNFARTYINSSFKTTSGVNWLDYYMQGWISPYSDEGQAYIMDILAELTSIGFDEILLSDFIFPVLGKDSLINYGSDLAKEDILANRLFEISNEYKVSLLLSDFAFSDRNITSGETNLENLAENVRNVYVDVTVEPLYMTTSQLYDYYIAFDIENKAIMTNDTTYVTNELSYIIN